VHYRGAQTWHINYINHKCSVCAAHDIGQTIMLDISSVSQFDYPTIYQCHKVNQAARLKTKPGRSKTKSKPASGFDFDLAGLVLTCQVWF
jgi:hypothetical protein